MSITPSISELLRLLSSFSLPITVTFILVCVTSALYFEERPLTLNESTVKVFLDRPLRSSTSFAEVEDLTVNDYFLAKKAAGLREIFEHNLNQYHNRKIKK